MGIVEAEKEETCSVTGTEAGCKLKLGNATRRTATKDCNGRVAEGRAGVGEEGRSEPA